jgi:putative transposase
MHRIDQLHLNYPFAGSRMLRDLLRGEGVLIGRELVATMMRRISKRSTASRTHRRRRWVTKSTLICCGDWRSNGPTRCG